MTFGIALEPIWIFDASDATAGWSLVYTWQIKINGRRNSSVGNASDLVTHRWAAHHCVGGSNPNAYERSLTSHAVYMLIQCTPLLVEKASVAPEVNLRNPLCAGEEARKWGNPPWLWNPGQTSPEVQNRGISGPTKRTCVLQKFKKKKKKINVVLTATTADADARSEWTLRVPKTVVFLTSKYVSFYCSQHFLLKFESNFMLKYLLICVHL